MNLYATNKILSKYVRPELLKIQEGIDNFTVCRLRKQCLNNIIINNVFQFHNHE